MSTVEKEKKRLLLTLPSGSGPFIACQQGAFWLRRDEEDLRVQHLFLWSQWLHSSGGRATSPPRISPVTGSCHLNPISCFDLRQHMVPSFGIVSQRCSSTELLVRGMFHTRTSRKTRVYPSDARIRMVHPAHLRVNNVDPGGSHLIVRQSLEFHFRALGHGPCRSLDRTLRI